MLNDPWKKRVRGKIHPQLKVFLPSCCCLFARNSTKVNSFHSLDFFAFFGCNIAATKAQLERLFFGLRLKAQNVYRDSQLSTGEMFRGELVKEEGKKNDNTTTLQ